MTVPDDKLDAVTHGMLHSWWADLIPDRLALISPDGDRTFADLNAQINRLSRALRSRGLKPGDAIALMCTNEPAFLEVLYAAQRTGLRLTPINWHLTGEEAATAPAPFSGLHFLVPLTYSGTSGMWTVSLAYLMANFEL